MVWRSACVVVSARQSAGRSRDRSQITDSSLNPYHVPVIPAPIYSWFTEGFNTADLKGAKALLGDLA